MTGNWRLLTLFFYPGFFFDVALAAFLWAVAFHLTSKDEPQIRGSTDLLTY